MRDAGAVPEVADEDSAADLLRKTGLETILTRATAYAVVALIAAMVVVIWISVFTRYVMNDPISWGEQVAKYLMIWGTFLGASLGLREGAHIAVHLLVDMMPLPLRKACALMSLLIVGGFLLVGMAYGAMFTYQVRSHSDPLVGEMSMAIPYAAIPVGCAMMLVQLLYSCRGGLLRSQEEHQLPAAE